jgi:hypothetical protein
MKKNFTSHRTEKRAFERQKEKALRNRKIVRANKAFNRIKSDLTDFGWIYEADHTNIIEHEHCRKWIITTSPALRLLNEVFDITLIPHEEGVEISRLEVFNHFQRRGYAGNFLKCVLQFLLQHEVDDIFLIPLPFASTDNLSSTTLNIPQLQRFYSKRGFNKLPKNDFWKLDKSTFSNYIKNMSIDYEILKESYTPANSPVFIGDLFNRRFKSMPIKMKINNRA